MNNPCFIEKENKICNFLNIINNCDYCTYLGEELSEEDIKKGCPNCEY